MALLAYCFVLLHSLPDPIALGFTLARKVPIIKGTEFQLHMHNLDVMVHCSKLVSLTNTAGAVSFPLGSACQCAAVCHVFIDVTPLETAVRDEFA